MTRKDTNKALINWQKEAWRSKASKYDKRYAPKKAQILIPLTGFSPPPSILILFQDPGIVVIRCRNTALVNIVCLVTLLSILFPFCSIMVAIILN